MLSLSPYSPMYQMIFHWGVQSLLDTLLIRTSKELSLDELTGIHLDAWYIWVVSHDFLRGAYTKLYARSHKMSFIYLSAWGP